MRIYLIGSLRNPRVQEVAKQLRTAKHIVFDNWTAAGPEADAYWQAYEMGRGHSFIEALQGYAARHVFEYDKKHLDAAEAVVLMTPAGKSGHLELGWALGRGIPSFILLDDGEPERWDVMYAFADGVYASVSALIEAL